MTIFRPAQETDLAQMYEVFYQNEILDIQNPPPHGDMSDLVHTFKLALYTLQSERILFWHLRELSREGK